MIGIERDPIFVALTRPQMVAGVPYSFFVTNAIVAAELFLIFRSIWVLPLALILHGVGAGFCLREPRIFDLWLVLLRTCPRIRNYAFWQCNSYRP